MTTIQLTLTGAKATAQVDGILTAGMVGVPVSISWDESWEGLVKTLVCKSDTQMRKLYNVGSTAQVAPEVMTSNRWVRNTLYLGVEGRDEVGTLVIPSTFAYCGVIQPGAQGDCPDSRPPDNPVWAQILHQMGNLEQLKTGAKENLVDAVNTLAEGAGQVKTINQLVPDDQGNVRLEPEDLGALPLSGGTMTGALNMNGKKLTGLASPLENSGAVSRSYGDSRYLKLSGGTMTGALSVKTPTASAHAVNKSYVDSRMASKTAIQEAVRWANAVNLLDNSNFRNLIAQMGMVEYHGEICYFADRWKLENGTVSYAPVTGKITFPQGATVKLAQILECDCAGKEMTLAIQASSVSGNVYLVQEGGTNPVNVTVKNGVTVHAFQGGKSQTVGICADPGASLCVDWIALYEGTYSTETLPVYRPRGYGEELDRCQRYAYRLQSLAALCYPCVYREGVVYGNFHLPQPMRDAPIVEMDPSNMYFLVNGTQGMVPYTAIWQPATQALDVVQMQVDVSGTLPQMADGTPVMLCMEEGSYVDFLADL